MSADMVSYCRAKGLDAHVMDFSRPDAGLGPFDVLYAMNCLLHVPNAEMRRVLESLRSLLRPGGLFFLGVYGGSGEEGPLADDEHVVPLRPDGFRFQSLTLRRPPLGMSAAGD
jgi:SAM-dependent methyltransferase